jgi:hypothetical protein
MPEKSENQDLQSVSQKYKHLLWTETSIQWWRELFEFHIKHMVICYQIITAVEDLGQKMVTVNPNGKSIQECSYQYHQN